MILDKQALKDLGQQLFQRVEPYTDTDATSFLQEKSRLPRIKFVVGSYGEVGFVFSQDNVDGQIHLSLQKVGTKNKGRPTKKQIDTFLSYLNLSRRKFTATLKNDRGFHFAIAGPEGFADGLRF